MTKNPYAAPRHSQHASDSVTRQRVAASHARALAHVTTVAAFIAEIVFELTFVGDDLDDRIPWSPLGGAHRVAGKLRILSAISSWTFGSLKVISDHVVWR
jgi:hypothetical protein